ncbi:unnamed protein product [Kuraishia capsulata CBS 1993]|uniref:Glutamate decarboxylase n=1 Tax=Kuraishia capsulata CBS 1993 TaxID=1382522 RepID=W6MH05_9ASCO|nr:uncharacterized protein KUCA_T00001168001 [Kuraishia capsulata CBS 1993]CDK25201.1 unnamed protein product [Kuraishia capsulata CBS 1993]
MTVTKAIDSDLEKNRVEELKELLPAVVERIIKHVEDTDLEKADIGPRFEDPKELLKILKLDDPHLFEDSLQSGSSSEVVAVFDQILKNSVNTWHPGFMDKLYASTNPIGVVSDLLLSVLNTNSHVFTVSPALSVIEKSVGRKYANLFGFDGPAAGGLTFSGGSWSNVTSLQMARSTLFPSTKLKGNSEHRFAVYTSKHSHYSVEKACILLGLGAESLFKIEVNEHGEMDVSELDKVIQKSVDDGYTPLYVNGTAGTTVFGSYDPFEEISAVAKKYGIWFHIDGSWGGNTIFSPSRKDRLNGSHLADSITSNPHKMLGVPTTCSFLLVPDERIFQQANSLAAPYLFHNSSDSDDNYDLADGTMGCGRRADSLKFYLGWLYYGTKGYAARVDHAYDIGKSFAKKISTIPGFKMIGDYPPPCLQVCFYYNPAYITSDVSSVDAAQNTAVTRTIATQLHSSGKFLIDYAPSPDGKPIKGCGGEFFRVVFNSPVVTNEVVDRLIDNIVAIGGTLSEK